jgi:hypothetical protein
LFGSRYLEGEWLSFPKYLRNLWLEVNNNGPINLAVSDVPRCIIRIYKLTAYNDFAK